MENSVTIMLLFCYSAIMGILAYKLLFYDRKKIVTRMKRAHSKYMNVGDDEEYDRSENKVEKLTDPVFNAKYEINRISKLVRMKSEDPGAEKAAAADPESLKRFKSDAAELSTLMNKYSEALNSADRGAKCDGRYEIEQSTLDLLINTLAYDDFARTYERFLKAVGEDEICSMIKELDSFREDDRLVMIVMPLLMHASPKVQQAINDFLSRNEKMPITEEIVDIMENADYINDVRKDYASHNPSGASEFRFLEEGMHIRKLTPAKIPGTDLSVEREIYFEEPHKLVMEAYKTSDHDRLFAISCALSQYDDPVVLEAMMHINSKLDGETAREPKIVGAAAREAVMFERPVTQPSVKKFEFNNINDVFRAPASDLVMPLPQLKKTAARASGAPAETKAHEPAAHAANPGGNDYVKGMKLVNMSKYMEFEEFFPEISGALNHETPYVRCCSIMAARNMAQRCHTAGQDDRVAKIRETLLSHGASEQNAEVESLGVRALAEIENFVARNAAIVKQEHGETLGVDYASAAAEPSVDRQISKPVVRSLFYNNVKTS